MKTIKELLQEKALLNCRLHDLEEKIQAAYNAQFETIPRIRKWIIELENSTDYQYNKYGDICQWLSVDWKEFKDCVKYLKNYLYEFDYCTLDTDTDCIISCGSFDEIVINHEGDIFQEQTVIIRSSEYETTEERNKLIEDHMEKTGVFPGVFLQDYNGGLTSVNTQAKEEK